MRILHTSDWHLGHSLHGLSRDFEHARFLDWLVEALRRERIDVLLVCGDVFDTANPSAAAQDCYYRFLARAHAAVPKLQIVVIAGNHDSAHRLQAPREILHAIRVHVVGAARNPDGTLWVERMVVPLLDEEGRTAAWCAAVPYLRPADLDLPAADPDNPLIDGVRRLYDEVLAVARERQEPGQALIGLGHCYMVGTEVSELSERKILGGNLHALPVGMFDTDLDYVALGHLHKAQRVGKRENVRYCGSPIALSMSEGRNRQQVCIVDVSAGSTDVQSLPVPRAVDLVRVPPQRAEPIEQVLERLAALPAAADFADSEMRPFLEVRVLLDKPVAGLRTQIEAKLEDRAPRLLKISVEYPAAKSALADVVAQPALQDLSSEQVFKSLYRARHDSDVPEPLLAAFHELVDTVGQGEGDAP